MCNIQAQLRQLSNRQFIKRFEFGFYNQSSFDKKAQKVLRLTFLFFIFPVYIFYKILILDILQAFTRY